MGYHAALGVPLRSVSTCVNEDDGRIQPERKAATDVAIVLNCLKRSDPTIDSVGYEAGPLMQYLTH